jgi:chorismate mutase
MYDELLGRNKLDAKDIVSCIFSITQDLNAINPCTALRKYLGVEIPNLAYALFSVQEPDVKNSLERTVRVIVHCYLEEGAKPLHVYRNGTEVLVGLLEDVLI